MSAQSRLRYGKTCDRCGQAIVVARGERALCGRHAADERHARGRKR